MKKTNDGVIEVSMDVVKIPIKLRIKTGLHIGGGEENYEIGGVDRPFIKTKKFYSNDEAREEPYIPGSSLKGKLRSLLESHLQYQGDEKEGEPHKCDRKFCEICDLFGRPSYRKKEENKEIEGKQSAIRVSDFFLVHEFRGLLEQQRIYEYKTENTINRLTGAAKNPRTTERIVPGVEFEGNITLLLNGYGNEEKKKLKNALWQALKLLEADYLGSDGSRGYGVVEIVNKREVVGKLGVQE